MPAFWAWFVAAGTIVFVIWCIWLVSWSAKQGPQGKEDEDLVGHKWDGDLEEWNNPAPKWWLYLYFGTLIWGVGYMVLYHGIGAFEGVLGWSQEGQYEQEMATAAERYAPIYERFAAMDFESPSADPDALALGRSLFASYCTTCHGSDARGAPGYPNLTDEHWIWGGELGAVEHSIEAGRVAAMPGWQAMLGDAGVAATVDYVWQLEGAPHDAAQAAIGKTHYDTVCIACHGPDGTGNPLLGAPDLTAGDYLYGGDRERLEYTIATGRGGIMQAFTDLLGEDRSRILAGYVKSLQTE